MVDVPLSPLVPDALLRLGVIVILRGRAEVARAHFERMVRDLDDSPQRPKAMVWIARSYFEERDLAHACEAVTALRARPVPDGELRLQADEMQVRCTAVSASTATTSAPATASQPTETAAAASEGVDRPRFSLQFAAYDTKSQATSLLQRLTKRGYKARIDGEKKPYRVRVGRYETRGEADAALARVKKAGQKAIIVELPK